MDWLSAHRDRTLEKDAKVISGEASAQTAGHGYRHGYEVYRHGYEVDK